MQRSLLFLIARIASMWCIIALAPAQLGAQITTNADALKRSADRARSEPSVVQQWAGRRRDIMAGAEELLGKLPEQPKSPPDVQVLDRFEGDGYVRLSITYQVDADERVPAYLLLSNDRRPGQRVPAIIALHPTSKYGKKLVAGEAVVAQEDGVEQSTSVPGMYPTTNTVYPNCDYAKELAQRGYVVLAPDYPSFGDYPFDFRTNKYASGSMKGIVNHMRGIDVLMAREEVDPERIAAIGHSLGGRNALFLGAFDQRVKVIVSSCGWCPFRDSEHGRKPGGWDQNVYMPRIRTVYNFDFDCLPCDLPDLAAALAPRAFFTNAPLRDFDTQGIKRVEPRIREVFALSEASDRLQIRYPNCGHDFPPEIRREAYAFIDRILQHTTVKNVP